MPSSECPTRRTLPSQDPPISRKSCCWGSPPKTGTLQVDLTTGPLRLEDHCIRPQTPPLCSSMSLWGGYTSLWPAPTPRPSSLSLHSGTTYHCPRKSNFRGPGIYCSTQYISFSASWRSLCAFSPFRHSQFPESLSVNKGKYLELRMSKKH